MPSTHYIGMDIGGTKCAVCIGDDEGKILCRESFPTEVDKGPQPAIDKMIALGKSMCEAQKVSPVAIGISAGSPLDPEKGLIQAPPNLPTWVDVPIVKQFSDAFGIPAFLDNDANAGALAEYQFGAGKGCKNMIFMTFGTGLGAGLILDGLLYRGTNCYAGETGHVRLEDEGPVGYHKAGSWEGFCSGGGIAQLAKTMKAAFSGDTCLPDEPTAKDVGEGAKAGDKLSLEIFEECGRKLGKGLAIILDLFNPERVVLGSIFVRCEEFLRPSMDEVLKAEALPYTYEVCEIVPAQLSESIGDHAAIAVAVDGMKKGS